MNQYHTNPDAMNRRNDRLIACLQAATELYNPFACEGEGGPDQTTEQAAERIARIAVRMERILSGEQK